MQQLAIMIDQNTVLEKVRARPRFLPLHLVHLLSMFLLSNLNPKELLNWNPHTFDSSYIMKVIHGSARKVLQKKMRDAAFRRLFFYFPPKSYGLFLKLFLAL